MTRWEALRADIEASRSSSKSKPWSTVLRAEVKRLVALQLCDESAPHWITQETIDGGGTKIGFLKYGDAELGNYRALALTGLPFLHDAKLSMSVVADRRNRLKEYTIGVVGQHKLAPQGWYVRIDLDPEQRGSGPCCHPVLHCHVGENPDGKGQESRTPLPWLDPDDALGWILATLDQQLEPK